MTATFAQLAVGTTEVQVAQALSREMEQRGAPGGGLVQFGPSSALPHGGPAGPKLEREGSEEHTSELQSPCNLGCRLLLEKKTILNHRRRQVSQSASTGPRHASY